MKNAINQALESAGLRFNATMTNSPIPEGFSAGSHAWKIVLRYQGRQATVPFYTGSMCGEATPADVLYCLTSDYNGAQQSFEGWCADYGYDTDSRKAEATYNACKKLGEKLARLLGTDLDMFADMVKDM